MNRSAAFLSRLILTMMCLSFAVPLHSADKDKELKRAVEALAENVANLKLQKLLCPRFSYPRPRQDRQRRQFGRCPREVAVRARKKEI
jgi:hypothetical protein